MEVVEYILTWREKIDRMSVRVEKRNRMLGKLATVGALTYALKHNWHLFDTPPALFTYNVVSGMLKERVGAYGARINPDQLSAWDALKQEIADEHVKYPERLFIRLRALSLDSRYPEAASADDVLTLMNRLVNVAICERRTGTFGAQADSGQILPETLHLRDPLL